MSKRFKRLILHAGMPKTGTTSLQKAFAAMSRDQVAPMDMGRVNHSAPCAAWFGGNVGDLPEVRSLKRTPDEMIQHLQHIQGRVRRQLDTATQDTLIISAETLTKPYFPHNNQLKKLTGLRNEFAPHFDRIEVRAYVRPPGPFLTSFFQHRMKRGDLSFIPEWVHYRARFEPLQQVFGAENLHLRLYDPGRFPGKDVIADFWNWMRWDGRPPKTLAANTGLNAAGVAITSCFLRNCPFERAQGWFLKRDMVVQLAKDLKAPKFRLGEATIARLTRGNEADLEWIRDALGEDLTESCEPPTPETFVFDTQDALKRAAAYYAPLLEGHTPQ